MKCRQAEEWMDAALDVAMARDAGDPGDAVAVLPGGWREQLDAHLDACPACRRLWTQLNAADAALRVPGPVTVPAGMLAEFRERLEQERHPLLIRRSPWVWLWPVGSLAAGAAAACLIAARLAPVPYAAAPGPGPRVAERLPRATTEEFFKTPAPRKPETRAELRFKTTEPAAPVRPAPPPFRKSPGDKPSRMASAAPLGDVAAPAPGAQDFAKVPAAPMREQLELKQRESETFGRSRDAGARDEGGQRERPSVLAAAPAQVSAAANAAGDASHYFYNVQFEAPGAAQDPPELRVSPAVLAALHRSVDVNASTTSVRQVAEALALEADVRVEVDPRVAQRPISLQEEGAPLWKALESVAQQGGLQVLPQQDHLLLKPSTREQNVARATAVAAPEAARWPYERAAAPPAPASAPAVPAEPAAPGRLELKPQAERTLPARTAAGAVARRPLARQRPGGSGQPLPMGVGGAAKAGKKVAPPDQSPASSRAKNESFAVGQRKDADLKRDANLLLKEARLGFGLRASGLPDRSVWPDAWGSLPERGFVAPAPEEIPPQMLNLEAGLANNRARLPHQAPTAAKRQQNRP